MPFAHGASAPRYHFAEPMALADIQNFLAIDERLGTPRRSSATSRPTGMWRS